MKLTHKLCGAALLAAVGVSLAIPSTTKALEDTNKGGMDIQFARKTTGDIDPGHSEEVVSSGKTMSIPGGTYKEFGVEGVTPLSFGEVTLAANARTFWAKNWTQEGVGSSANYVLINDERLTEDHNYSVSGQITGKLKAGEKELSGSTLMYSNIHLQSKADASIALPESAVADGKTVTITEGETTPIINSRADADKAKGQGRTHITFGYIKATDATASDKSVALSIGNDQTVTQGDYTGEITWTMSTTK
ncbi:WxL domain-containing protein [Enterococcus ureasiticus]|uniref:WxL domain-containing protein n=1 Tax=Enterococcus ureasiticus TaxID=903984 RepID=A0A1E5GAP3_9ENTE|nr:WxL domain-containing protein [Enterococcus ureasiticus]OEG09721.1 hypothetical protein BCR21_15390 [Enterococcus ureasiticus]